MNKNIGSKKQKNKKNNQLWDKIKRIFTIEDTIMDETFSLGKREIKKFPNVTRKKQSETEDRSANEKEKATGERNHKKLRSPKKIGQSANQSDSANHDASGKGRDTSKDGMNRDQDEREANKWEVSSNIEVNKERVKKVFIIPPNKDVVIREFYIALKKPVKAFIVYIDGAVNSKVVDDNILQPLMLLAHMDGEDTPDKDPFDIVNKRLTPINQASPSKEFKKLVTGVLNGDTAIFVDGSNQALAVETKGWPGRSVSDPKNENTIRGPQEGFAENLRTNTGLVRKRLRNEGLVTEIMAIGRYSQTNVAMLYIDGIVNPKLVREMKRRLKSIKIDYAADSGIIEQYIDDNTRSFVPNVLSTERPDRVAAFLCEGHVAIIVDGSTYALIMPVTLWAQLHTPEDYYLKWPYGTFLRWLRFISLFLGMLTPAIYIAITNYHPEMIPTDLLLSIAATREKVPFPVVVEVLLMEFSFELIREAGIRIPGVIGPTIGIVGALILGQAAVAASIVSPILVIVVAITGLASSALPSYSFNLALRVIRFLFIIFAALFGFVGIAVLLFLLNIHTMGQKSLGVPVASPVAPFRPPSNDQVTIVENFKFNEMPKYTRPMKRYRQVKYNRLWDPVTQNLFQEDQAAPNRGPTKEGGDEGAAKKS